jgi:predicted kinase
MLLRGDVADQSVNAEVFALLRQLVRQRLQLGVSVTYIDATNLTRRERRQWIKIADWYGASCEAIYFDEPIETCLQRNLKRERVVPEAVIWRMAGRLTPPEPHEGFALVQVVSSSQEQ